MDLSPASAVHRLARYLPDAPSLVYGERTFTAVEVDGRAARLATLLAVGGVRAGDRVAYTGLNSATLLITYLACMRLRAVFLPVNFRLAAEEVGRVLDDAGAHTVIAEEGHRSIVDKVAGAVPVRRYLLVDDDPAVPVTGDPSPPWRRLSAALDATTGTPAPPQPCRADDLAALLYTSGTTGRAKGVMLTYGNLWWNDRNFDAVTATGPDDVGLVVAPLFHVGGLNGFALRIMARGGTVVVRRGFDPERVAADIARHRVTGMFAVPVMYAALLRPPAFVDGDRSSLRTTMVAGAPVPPGLITEYAEHGIMLEQAWGLTETAPMATHLPAGRTMAKLGSAGIPAPYTEIRLVRPGTLEEITEPHVRGEICVRGPNVTPGYWNNPAETAAAFDDAGWFHSGDIGELDPDGYLYIVDRLKDMIITGGENVYPAEVERVLVDYPGVLDVAVVGAPHETWGETVVAVLSCAQGASPTVEDLAEFAGGRLARYKLPTRVLVRESLPRSPSGKLDKPSLRAWVRDRP
ncbi:MAG TPA: AMP-binding protein [Actinophytocola sp.]|uniref:AMP-binding protein n=1 Tax=Actinophytocola sp. TaxID=1872138 RepID=UPI002DDD6CAA|nr:AMP-binding protein [Actinophytocola sp.]HEV2778702.1 AMP-binding protein [Actinophytocola sp.]